jgi:hypothetical protein
VLKCLWSTSWSWKWACSRLKLDTRSLQPRALRYGLQSSIATNAHPRSTLSEVKVRLLLVVGPFIVFRTCIASGKLGAKGLALAFSIMARSIGFSGLSTSCRQDSCRPFRRNRFRLRRRIVRRGCTHDDPFTMDSGEGDNHSVDHPCNEEL